MGNRAPFALSSPLKHAAIKLSCLMFDAKRVPGFSLLVRFNGGRTLLLLMNRRRRRSSGLYRIRDNVTVGDVSFEHAAVAVSDKKFLTDVDGLIGLDVFSMFLVTVDFQKMVLKLAPGWELIILAIWERRVEPCPRCDARLDRVRES